MPGSHTIIFMILIFLFLLIFNPLPVPQSLNESDVSLKIFSEDGSLLREKLAAQGGRRSSVSLNDVAPEFIDSLIFSEDKRFYAHFGVDPLALIRATYQNIKNGRIISGASTLTMQISRHMNGGKRTFTHKIKEMFFAVYLEMSLSKEEILTKYVNEMPFGNELYGIRQASEMYFRKKPADLSLSESAWLIGIIRAPSFYNPYRNPEAVLKLRDKILHQYSAADFSLQEKIVLYPFETRFLAPHFTDFVLQNSKGRHGKIQTTLDLELNRWVEQIIQFRLARLKERQVKHAAVLVVSNKDAKIRAYVGSQNYWDDKTEGMNDGVLQFRQPGSTLKTFNYARAIDLGLSPSHVLADVKTVYPSVVGDYIPENYDRQFGGPVLLRQALANSLNVPAVQLLNEMGQVYFYEILKKMGFSQLKERPDYYGLGLTLGNVEVNLFELVRAYSVFGRQGNFCELGFFADGTFCAKKPTDEIFSKKTITVIRDFLADKYARTSSFGSAGPLDFEFPVMIKTGTSQNYRDNWTVAVTPDYTVGVWVGNFNGAPMQNVSGVTGAAPIVHDVVEFLHEKKPWTAWVDSVDLKKTEVCFLSGKKPTSLCPLRIQEYQISDENLSDCDFHVVKKIDKRTGLLAGNSCPQRDVESKTFVELPGVYSAWQQESWPDSFPPLRFSLLCESTSEKITSASLEILSPEDGVVYKVDLHRPQEAQYLSLKTNLSHQEFQIFLDGEMITNGQSQNLSLIPGNHILSLKEGEKTLDEVKFWVRY